VFIESIKRTPTCLRLDATMSKLLGDVISELVLILLNLDFEID
jgi:hypothetical protein